ncbi:hypothetical protein ULF88_00855 [Halopseudomonas pachastrellae]|nr:hypothetical protein [Halopseudomonas pachastrellae]
MASFAGGEAAAAQLLGAGGQQLIGQRVADHAVGQRCAELANEFAAHRDGGFYADHLANHGPAGSFKGAGALRYAQARGLSEQGACFRVMAVCGVQAGDVLLKPQHAAQLLLQLCGSAVGALQCGLGLAGRTEVQSQQGGLTLPVQGFLDAQVKDSLGYLLPVTGVEAQHVRMPKVCR